MTTVASGFAILLSLTFAVSAAGKLADPRGTRSGLRSLQIPFPQLHGILAIAAPLAELYVAIGVWVPIRGVAASAALVGLAMMLAFTVIIARALRFEDAVHCACFGTLGSPTVGPSTLVRNLVLSAVALIAFLLTILGPGIYPGQELLTHPLAVLTLLLLLVLSPAIVLLILGGTDRFAGEADATPARSGRAPVRAAAPTAGAPETPAAGSSEAPVEGTAVSADQGADAHEDEDDDYLRAPIPFSALKAPDGTPHTLRELASHQAVLLLFFSPGCGACLDLMPKVQDWKAQFEPHVRVITVFSLDLSQLPEETARQVEGTQMEEVDSSTSMQFDIYGRPAAVLLGADGLMAGGPVAGGRAVERFVGDILEQLADAPLPDQADPDAASTDAESSTN